MSNYTEILSKKFLSTVKLYSMLDDVDCVVVGLSGGADSVCLLHLLHKLKNEFSYSLLAVHVNHGIRGEEAERDAVFAENFCNNLNVPFKLVCVNCPELSENNKESLEETGRKARYEAFNCFCTQKSKIATAHNSNDNAETLIFNLTRGSSLKGACGIPYFRENIIRPLLDCSREEIEGYCSENGLQFITDSTNLSDEYTRNKIRHNILPVLEELNSDYLNKITQFCRDCESVNLFLQDLTTDAYNRAVIKENCYDAEYILSLNEYLAKEVILRAFNDFSSILLERKQISFIYSLLSKGGRLQIKSNIFAEVKQNKLRFFEASFSENNNAEVLLSVPFDVEFSGYAISGEYTECSKKFNQKLADNLIDCDKISGDLVLRTRLSGDRITLRKRNVTKSLKKLFCEENIPFELRDFIPVISDDNGVVWVYGFGVNKRCEVTSDSHNIIYIRGKNNDRK